MYHFLFFVKKKRSKKNKIDQKRQMLNRKYLLSSDKDVHQHGYLYDLKVGQLKQQSIWEAKFSIPSSKGSEGFVVDLEVSAPPQLPLPLVFGLMRSSSSCLIIRIFVSSVVARCMTHEVTMCKTHMLRHELSPMGTI